MAENMHMAITFDSDSAVVPDPSDTSVGGSVTDDHDLAFDLSIVSANRRAEEAEVQAAFEKAQAARMRFEALRLAEAADDLAVEVAKMRAELEASRAETARMHGVVVATRIEADQATTARSVLASEVESLTAELAQVDSDLSEAREELIDLRAAVADNQAKSETDRENLDSAIRLAAEFDELRHDRRVERDAARLEADRNKRLWQAASARIDELETQAAGDRELEDARLLELAQLAQQEVDDAFAAGSRLGDRAALRAAVLEKELAEARRRIKSLAGGDCPDPSAHSDLHASMSNHPTRATAVVTAAPIATVPAPRRAPTPPPAVVASVQIAASTRPPANAALTSLRQRIEALPPAPHSGR